MHVAVVVAYHVGMRDNDAMLLTPRLCLSRFTLADADDVFEYGADPAVARYTSWPTHTSRDDSVDWLERVLAGERSEAGRVRRCYAIRLAGSPRVIGAVEFKQHPVHRGRVDYVLARPHWGQGLMTEAVCSVVGWAFAAIPELTEIASGGLLVNVGSMRVMEKVGMTRESTERLLIPKFGLEPVEVAHYKLTRAAWARS
jgi:ribosomal-protein-alanine N-acetyltransferase